MGYVPTGYTEEQWKAIVEQAQNLFNSYYDDYMVQAKKIAKLNAQIIAISFAKSSLYSCKNNIESSDALLAEIKEDSIKVDYGSNYHAKIESLTDSQSNSASGFEKTISTLNTAKDKIKIELSDLGDLLEQDYNCMATLNQMYYLGLALPNKDTIMNLLDEAMSGG